METIDLEVSDAVGIPCLQIRHLWAAVLRQAITDLREERLAGRGGLTPLDACPSWPWFASDSPRIGGFVWVCCQFDVDPPRARKAIRKQVYA